MKYLIKIFARDIVELQSCNKNFKITECILEIALSTTAATILIL